MLLVDSARSLALAVNRGDAARTLELEPRRSRCAGAGVSAFGSAAPPPPEHRIRPTTAPASSQRPGHPTARWSPPAEQSAGRGRRGRTWAAPAGQALLYSAILRPLELHPRAAPARGAGGRLRGGRGRWRTESTRGSSGQTTSGSMKRKVAGVLIEARPPEWAVIGIGVNVAIDTADFPADLRWTGHLDRRRRHGRRDARRRFGRPGPLGRRPGRGGPGRVPPP